MKSNFRTPVAIVTIIIIITAGILSFLFLTGEVITRTDESDEKLKILDNSVFVVNLDKKLIRQKIDQGTDFLFKAMDENKYGFHKYYHTFKDSFDDQLVSVYSASIVYTLLYANELETDNRILKHLSKFGDFLLSMQNKDKSERTYGAFHYSYQLETGTKENRFVVGTSALNIFTLIELYDLTEENRYLESAKLAGNWLTTMQNLDGTINPYLERGPTGAWWEGNKESLLYQGQVLSSLSRLYRVTEDQKYYETAKKIADRYVEKYKNEQGYVEGEYRDKNPISNSWVVMSLLDFYKASREEKYKDVVLELSDLILKEQITDKDFIRNHGRWRGAYSTSGNGWISEVMAETYLFCRDQGINNCEKYKEAVVRGIRWIIQNTYSEEHQKILKIPDRAIGGVYWNVGNWYVRTDSICHALNSYILILDHLEDGILISME